MKAFTCDTLAKRLFLLMWIALVLSHLAGYLTVHALYVNAASAAPTAGVSIFPSLPPTPGMPSASSNVATVNPAVIELPWKALLLDYGVRIAVIALAAWSGSRWLARPMRDLVAASRALGSSVIGGQGVNKPSMLNARQGTQEVREAAQVFNAMAARLHDQFKARDLMVAAMSHDLRTPLTRMRMRFDAMDAAGDASANDPSAVALRERSIADICEMDRLIGTVLGVFRGDALAASEAKQETAVAALLQALTDDLIEQGQAVCISVPAQADGQSHRDVTRVEPAALRRIVDNLVGNALRYAGAAEVSMQLSEQQICIVVEDSGPGIPPEHLEAVFEPFFRVDPSRNRHMGGTGLGLYIARELALRQGAQIVLNNRTGGGLRAVVVLPRLIRSAGPSLPLSWLRH